MRFEIYIKVRSIATTEQGPEDRGREWKCTILSFLQSTLNGIYYLKVDSDHLKIYTVSPQCHQ